MTILYIPCQCILFLEPSLQVPDQADMNSTKDEYEPDLYTTLEGNHRFRFS